jgi:hypothetical protein
MDALQGIWNYLVSHRESLFRNVGFLPLTLVIIAFTWRTLSPICKVLACQVFLAAINHILLPFKFPFWRIPESNGAQMNFYLLIETALILYAVAVFVRKKWAYYGVFFSYLIFLSFWLYEVITNYWWLANYSLSTANVLFLGWYLYVLYETSYHDGATLRNPIVWVSLAFVLESGVIPYFIMFHFIHRYYDSVHKQLEMISIVFAWLRYVCFCTAFLLSPKFVSSRRNLSPS